VRIGVLSDTHGLLRPEVLEAFAGVNHILHGGDIGDVQVLRDLEKIAPVTAVAGNIDGFRCGKAGETARVELEGVRFFLTHILDRPRQLLPGVARALARSPADVVVFGHSHLPHDETIDGVRYLNPASAGPRRFDLPVSVAVLEVAKGKVRTARFVGLDDRSNAALQKRMNQLSAE